MILARWAVKYVGTLAYVVEAAHDRPVVMFGPMQGSQVDAFLAERRSIYAMTLHR